MTRFILILTLSVLPQLISAQQSIIFVNPSGSDTADGSTWSAAVSTLERAIALANMNADTTEIRLTHGVYKPTSVTGNRAFTLPILTPIRIVGGYRNVAGEMLKDTVSVISGDVLGDGDTPNPFFDEDDLHQFVRLSGQWLYLENLTVLHFKPIEGKPLISALNSSVSAKHLEIEFSSCLFSGCLISVDSTDFFVDNFSVINKSTSTEQRIIKSVNSTIKLDISSGSLNYSLVDATSSSIELSGSLHIPKNLSYLYGISAISSSFKLIELSISFSENSTFRIYGDELSDVFFDHVEAKGDSTLATNSTTRSRMGIHTVGWRHVNVLNSAFQFLIASDNLFSGRSITIQNSVFSNIKSGEVSLTYRRGTIVYLADGSESLPAKLRVEKSTFIDIDGYSPYSTLYTEFASTCWDCNPNAILSTVSISESNFQNASIGFNRYTILQGFGNRFIRSSVSNNNPLSTLIKTHVEGNSRINLSQGSVEEIIMMGLTERLIAKRIDDIRIYGALRISGSPSITASMVTNLVADSLNFGTTLNNTFIAFQIDTLVNARISNSSFGSLFTNPTILSSVSILSNQISGSFFRDQNKNFRIVNSIVDTPISGVLLAPAAIGVRNSILGSPLPSYVADAGNNRIVTNVTTESTIDRGDNSFWDTMRYGSKDLLGNVRIWDGDNNGSSIIDIGPAESGAPEFIEPPLAPASASLEPNATIVDLSPKLSWSTVPGASQYRLQLSPTNDFATPIANHLITASEFTAVGLQHSTTYHWRVRAENVAGVSDWSQASFTTIVERPMIPMFSTPTAENALVDSMLVLRWSSTTRATSYEVSWSADSLFEFEIGKRIVTATETILPLSPGTAYWLRLRAMNDGGVSDWAVRTVRTKYSVPIWITPTDSAITSTLLQLIWTSRQVNTYMVEVSISETFDSHLISENMDSSRLQLSGLEYSTRYFARVRSGSNTWHSDWSEISFTTVPDPLNIPIAPIAVSPIRESNHVPIDAWFMWTPTPLAESYELQISTDSSFAALLPINGEVLNKQITPVVARQAESLPHDSELFWRVRGSNRSGIGKWSSIQSFRTIQDSLSKPVLVNPAPNSLNVPVAASLTWDAVDRANRYEISFSTDPTFTSDSRFRDLVETRLSLPVLTDTTTYHWRVRAFGDMVASRWSDVRQFRTELRVPEIPNWSPSQQDTTVSLNTTLSWAPTPRANEYEIKLGVEPELGVSAFIGKTTQTTYELSDLTPSTRYYWSIRAWNSSGSSDWSAVRTFKTLHVTSTEETSDGIGSFALNPAVPNPFNPVTKLSFTLDLPEVVTMRIYTIQGALVSELVSGAKQAGTHTIVWNATQFSSGIYIVELIAGSNRQSRMVTLLK